MIKKSMYNRRDFIKSVLRKTSIAALAVGSGYLLFREKPEEECSFDFVCKNCKKLNKCNLLEARDYKSNL